VTVEALARSIADSSSVVAFTGAGISTESGIPDFRGPQGVWTKVDPSEFTIQNYIANREHRRRVWQMRLERSTQTYQPNDGHRALVDLERMGKLDCVITQNIDGLHQAAGSDRVLELHGSWLSVKCLSCDRRDPAEVAYQRVRAGEDDPHCLECGGLLKSATVSFGESLPAEVVDEAFMRASDCDLMIAIGSSLVVYPAAGIPMAAARAGARLVIINHEPTPMDEFAALVIRGGAGEVLRQAVDAAHALLAEFG
jgi:NAD-dependent deacetylase